jgi:hypothetical protein
MCAFVYTEPFISVGSTSMDSTNHGSKTFLKNCMSTEHI